MRPTRRSADERLRAEGDIRTKIAGPSLVGSIAFGISAITAHRALIGSILLLPGTVEQTVPDARPATAASA